MRRMNNGVLEICGADSEVVFSLEEKLVDGVLNIKLYGEIKNEVAFEFEDEIMAALMACNQIELDFENVSYIASMALKSLLSAQQMIDGMDGARMVLRQVPESVMKTFRDAGFLDILEIETE